jgi:cytochrome c553
MRKWWIAALLLTAACQQKPREITFDGAETSDKAALIRHGERLTHVLGCTGCHGARLQGEAFDPEELAPYAVIYASNLSREVPEYTDHQLDQIIRHGNHPGRKSLWIMPSEVFQRLSDADFTALVAYLRTLRPTGEKLPPPRITPLGQKSIDSGEVKPAAQLVQEYRGKQPVDLGASYALGRYIVSATCAECHGPSLEGDPRSKIPNLIVAGGYSRAEFEKLITQGVPTGNRKLREMMSDVAKYRFSRLTPHERDAVYAYLKARAEQP